MSEKYGKRQHAPRTNASEDGGNLTNKPGSESRTQTPGTSHRAPIKYQYGHSAYQGTQLPQQAQNITTHSRQSANQQSRTAGPGVSPSVPDSEVRVEAIVNKVLQKCVADNIHGLVEKRLQHELGEQQVMTKSAVHSYVMSAMHTQQNELRKQLGNKLEEQKNGISGLIKAVKQLEERIKSVVDQNERLEKRVRLSEQILEEINRVIQAKFSELEKKLQNSPEPISTHEFRCFKNEIIVQVQDFKIEIYEALALRMQSTKTELNRVEEMFNKGIEELKLTMHSDKLPQRIRDLSSIGKEQNSPLPPSRTPQWSHSRSAMPTSGFIQGSQYSTSTVSWNDPAITAASHRKSLPLKDWLNEEIPESPENVPPNRGRW